MEKTKLKMAEKMDELRYERNRAVVQGKSMSIDAIEEYLTHESALSERNIEQAIPANYQNKASEVN